MEFHIYLHIVKHWFKVSIIDFVQAQLVRIVKSKTQRELNKKYMSYFSNGKISDRCTEVLQYYFYSLIGIFDMRMYWYSLT